VQQHTGRVENRSEECRSTFGDPRPRVGDHRVEADRRLFAWAAFVASALEPAPGLGDRLPRALRDENMGELALAKAGEHPFDARECPPGVHGPAA
jgi:hypothetical protein